MSAPIVPISKIGTPFQSPSWRYQATFCPERFGFAQYCSKPQSNSASLTRLVPNGLAPVEKYNLPIYIKQLRSKLTTKQYSQLTKVWNKHYFRTRDRKITFNVDIRRPGLLNWHTKKLESINDVFLKKLIKYCYNIEGDEYIADAIKFYKNKSNNMTVRWMNYSIYGGKTDKELAIQWNKPLKFIEAL